MAARRKKGFPSQGGGLKGRQGAKVGQFLYRYNKSVIVESLASHITTARGRQEDSIQKKGGKTRKHSKGVLVTQSLELLSLKNQRLTGKRNPVTRKGRGTRRCLGLCMKVEGREALR